MGFRSWKKLPVGSLSGCVATQTIGSAPCTEAEYLEEGELIDFSAADAVPVERGG